MCPERWGKIIIDSYAQQYITKNEFEPRIKIMRQNLKNLQEHQAKLIAQKNEIKEMELIVTNFARFANGISSSLINLDWNGKRDIIRSVVKRIEMSNEEINIVYKINELFQNKNTSPQHCCNHMLRSKRGSLSDERLSTYKVPFLM
jgi:site-specific DNA recombinase